jgi:hypothetical protein
MCIKSVFHFEIMSVSIDTTEGKKSIWQAVNASSIYPYGWQKLKENIYFSSSLSVYKFRPNTFVSQGLYLSSILQIRVLQQS